MYFKYLQVPLITQLLFIIIYVLQVPNVEKYNGPLHPHRKRKI